MIIQARYRDIPWEEAKHHLEVVTDNETECASWSKLRGQPVLIETPAFQGIVLNSECDGPFFWAIDHDGYICPHIAEIGD